MTIETGCLVTNTERKAILRGIKRSEVTARSFDEYYETFGYSRESLKDKVILDIGSGLSNFSRKAEAFGARVIKLDGLYSTRWLLLSDEEKKDAVTAAAQYLPFKDNIFDETISLHCPYYIEVGIDKIIREMIRVTKSDGKIKIHPMYNTGFTYALKNEPVLSMVEGEDADTLIISKDPRYSDTRWAELAGQIEPSLAFR